MYVKDYTFNRNAIGEMVFLECGNVKSVENNAYIVAVYGNVRKSRARLMIRRCECKQKAAIRELPLLAGVVFGQRD